MKIYISTGGYKNENINSILSKMEKNSILDIELSGGIYNKNIYKILKKKKNFNFQVHNYFPIPKKAFVLNLASTDKTISRLSIKHVKNSIRFAKKINAKYYSFHAGFLCDLLPSELGKRVKKKKLNSRKKSISVFLKNLRMISKYAKKYKINVMVENNVITRKNLNEFGTNPLLMCDPIECLSLLKKFPKNIKMLLDVGHLNVSAKTLAFNKKDMFQKCEKFIKGYHLSDNDGLTDANQKFNNKSWFIKLINKDVEYISIEVYGESEQKLFKLKKLLLDNVYV